MNELIAERDALKAQLAAAEADSKTLNELGHALGVCYCTDQGCYTAEPKALIERANKLRQSERDGYDWDTLISERDALRTQISTLAEALIHTAHYFRDAPTYLGLAEDALAAYREGR